MAQSKPAPRPSPSAAKIVRAAIHPAIGIARVGNSAEEFYYGPEVPEPLPRPPGFYKDGTGALKREAARFRVYGYDAAGNVVADLGPLALLRTGGIEVAVVSRNVQAYDAAPFERLGADPRVDTIGVFNSGVTRLDPKAPPPFPIPDVATLAKLHGPVLLVNGHDTDFMMETSKATYDWLERKAAFYGARHGAGHSATFFHPGGGEFANVAWSWAAWQLKGDKKAGAMFVGKSCGLCANSNWDTESKGLE